MPAFNATEMLAEAAAAARVQGNPNAVYTVFAGALLDEFDLGPTPGMVTQLEVIAGLVAGSVRLAKGLDVGHSRELTRGRLAGRS